MASNSRMEQAKTRYWLMLALVVLLAAACSGANESGDDGEDGEARSGATGPLTVELAAGDGQPDDPDPVPTVEGTALDESEIDGVIAALGAWPGIGGTPAEEFRRPEESLPPPLTGEIVDVPFPAGTDEPVSAVDTGPLEVLRFQPTGAVPIAPYVSVTFNQPMVPLAALDRLDTIDRPVTMTPDLDGTWQWIGTRTLRFESGSEVIDRLPMATTYTVEIPAGTMAQSGEVLGETVSWEFETPTPKVETFVPESESLPLEPVFLATFDQRIDPDDVLEVTTLEVGGEERGIRLATDDEIAADELIAARIEQSPDGRWLALRAVDSFETDTGVEVTFGPGIPSAEGSDTDSTTPGFRSRTYAALRVDDTGCDGDRSCRAGEPIAITFNNDLDLEEFDSSLVTVSPEIPGLSAVATPGGQVRIFGSTKGDTTYDITFDASLSDVFGQTLGDGVTVSLDVKPARPSLTPFDRRLITVDPLSEVPRISVGVVGHDELRVRAFAVDPVTDWPGYLAVGLLAGSVEVGLAVPVVPPDWPMVLDTTIAVGADEDDRMEVSVDLTEAFGGQPGHVVVLVEPTGELAALTRDDEDYWSNRPTAAWVQSTSIGVDAFTDQDEMLVWATGLATGEPLAGVEVRPADRPGATTDNDGLATITLTPSPTGSLLATLGDDTALLPTNNLVERPAIDTALWYTFDDRGIYRPGETVRVKGWVRMLRGEDAQLDLFGTGGDSNDPDSNDPDSNDTDLTYVVRDALNNELARGTAPLSALGGFNVELDLPEAVNLGRAQVQFMVSFPDGPSFYSHSFEIQDFRRPEFEVTTQVETPAPQFVGGQAEVSVSATYFAGGPLPDAPVEWNVWTREATYTPPNRDDFVFGIWEPWWYDDRFVSESIYEPPFYEEPVEPATFTGVTDGSGRQVLQLDFGGDGDGLPTSVTAEATVFDVNRQAWTSTTDLLVHPSELYVGIRGTRTFVKPGDDLVIEAIVTDLDGEAVVDRPVVIEASRLESRYVDGVWDQVPVDTETCEVISASEPVECRFTTDVGGRYQVTARVADESGRSSRSELTRWVSGGTRVAARDVELEEVNLIPDAEEYAPGDVAELLVEAPFSPAYGLATISRNGLVSTQTFRVDDFAAVVEVPVTDEQIPNLAVQIDIVGVTERTSDDGTPLPDLPKRPAYATGRIDLAVAPASRTLSVSVEPRESTVEPGGRTTLDIEVTDPDGAPVSGAELAVVVVDEAVLALTDYELSDPASVFYRPIVSQVSTDRSRDHIRLIDPIELREQMGGGGSDEESDEATASLPLTDGPAEFAAYDADRSSVGGAAPVVDVRTNFDALAVFEPLVMTGDDGTAAVDVPLPDNLTRYRVMVVAADGSTRYGTGESSITAGLPLAVRPSPPRFLNFGDTFELAVVLANRSDEPIEVDVVVETDNLELTDGEGRRVTVPADDRVEVRFPAAAVAAGTAGFRVVAVSGDAVDAAEGSMPVYTPATSEAFATYGVVDDGAIVQAVEVPDDVFPQFGGLEVDTSSTALQALTDAVLYIHAYDYASSDAYASRILTVVALRDVLDAFQAEGLPPADELAAAVNDDIAALLQLQWNDGGFLGWSSGRESVPFNSIQAVHALVRARDEGYAVPSGAIDQGLSYLADIENRFPATYSQATRDTLTAYALHVRAVAGDRAPGEAAALYGRAGDALGLDGLAWLLPVLDDEAARNEILQIFNNSATETAGAATFTTSYGDDAYLILQSERRTDGIILDALISQVPESDLIPKVVAGLLGNQTRGRWNNIQENTFILLALNRYFETFEAETPDFVARIWLGDLYAGEYEYSGFTTDRGQTRVSMGDLIDVGDGDLVVARDGVGRLYYRLGLRYAPANLELEPRDRGFVVSRTYEAVDDPEDVRRDDDGVWRINAGARVRVSLSMVADSRRTHVILIDPLAAGTEPLNPELAVTGELPTVDDEQGAGPRWWWRWFDHENLRDDRAEAYTSLLSAGTYEYDYIVRATTPGRFVVPPARAEQIYQPDVFGRSGTDIVIVEVD